MTDWRQKSENSQNNLRSLVSNRNRCFYNLVFKDGQYLRLLFNWHSNLHDNTAGTFLSSSRLWWPFMGLQNKNTITITHNVVNYTQIRNTPLKRPWSLTISSLKFKDALSYVGGKHIIWKNFVAVFQDFSWMNSVFSVGNHCKTCNVEALL